jgi:hypothetical protein
VTRSQYEILVKMFSKDKKMKTTFKKTLFLALIIFISAAQVNADTKAHDIKTRMHTTCEKMKDMQIKLQKMRADIDEIMSSMETSHVELNQIKDSDVFKENTKQGMRQTD